MAIKIPQYDVQFAPSGGIQAAATPLQQTPVLGAALDRFGDAGIFLATQVTKNINEGRVREVDNQASEAIREALYNPEKGYLTTTGSAAINGYKATETNLRDIGAKLASGLDDGAQRGMFAAVWQRRLDSALNSTTLHAAQQSKVYNQGQAEARTANSLADAVANANDPPTYELYKNTMMESAVYGLDGEQAKLALSKASTEMHTEIISNMIAQDSSKGAANARAWYAKHYAEIAPAAHDNILKALEAGGLKEDSLNLSMRLIAEHRGYQAQTTALNEQFKAGTISAEMHDATLQRLDYEHAKAKQAEGDYNNSMEGAAQDWVLKNPGKSVLDMPTNLYAYAKKEGKLAMLSSFAKGSGQGPGDDALFTQLRFNAADDPVAFVENFRANSANYRGKLDDQQYNNLLGVATSSESKDLRAQDVVKLSAATVRGVNADLRAAGIDTTPKEGSPEATQWQSYQSQLFQALDTETQAQGHSLKPDEARKIALGLLKKQEIEIPFWFNKKKMSFEMTDEERASIAAPTIQSISREDRQRYSNVLMNRRDLWARFNLKNIRSPQTQPGWDDAILMIRKAEDAGVKF